MAERHVAVLGPMGAGKSTLADALARRLRRPLRDSDRDVERRTGRTGRAISETDGVDALHALEEAVLLDALRAPVPSVIAAAGWTVEVAACRAALAERAVVLALELSVDAQLERLASATQEHRRSTDRVEVAAAEARRAPLVAGLADHRLDAHRSPEELVAAALAVLPALGVTVPDEAG